MVVVLGTLLSQMSWIFAEDFYSRRQLYPRVSSAIVHRDGRRWKSCFRKTSNSDAYRIVLADLCMEQVGTAYGTKPEDELRALIAGADIFGRLATYRIGRSKTCQRREHAARPALAGEAMTDAYTARFTLYLDTQLPA